MYLELLSSAFSSIITFALYVLGQNSFPKPLSPSDERECFERMSNGDTKARAKLIEHNLRLITHIIKKYYSTTSEQEDLISIGTIGLIKAVSSFDYTKGTRFATYASRCIENEILMSFRKKRKAQNEILLSEPIDTDSEGGTLTIGDIIAENDDMVENYIKEASRDELHRAIKVVLNDREKKIVCLRYGLVGTRRLTQREVARYMRISRSYVSRLEKSALEKLRSYLEPMQ